MYRGIVGEVRVRSKSCIEWEIPDFFTLMADLGDFYHSLPFDAGGGRWYWRVFLNGVTGFLPPGRMCLTLNCVSTPRSPTLFVTLAIPRAELRRSLESLPDQVMCTSPVSVLLRSKMVSETNALLLTLDMRRNASPYSSIQTTSESGEAEGEKKQSLEKKGPEKVAEDLGKLLVSCENSDLTVQVGDKEFRAHKAILSARCPAFSAMFQHQTAEKESNRIQIEDCTPEDFKDFLHYLYTGSVKSLTAENVFGIYRLADRYLTGDLKSQCLRGMGETLCVETFCETVKVALLHGEEDLHSRAISFGREHILSILRSTEWENFNCENPKQANETLIQCHEENKAKNKKLKGGLNSPTT